MVAFFCCLLLPEGARSPLNYEIPLELFIGCSGVRHLVGSLCQLTGSWHSGFDDVWVPRTDTVGHMFSLLPGDGTTMIQCKARPPSASPFSVKGSCLSSSLSHTIKIVKTSYAPFFKSSWHHQRRPEPNDLQTVAPPSVPRR